MEMAHATETAFGKAMVAYAHSKTNERALEGAANRSIAACAVFEGRCANYIAEIDKHVVLLTAEVSCLSCTLQLVFRRKEAENQKRPAIAATGPFSVFGSISQTGPFENARNPTRHHAPWAAGWL